MKTDVGQDDSVSLSPEITIITTVLSSMSRTTSSARISVKADSTCSRKKVGTSVHINGNSSYECKVSHTDASQVSSARGAPSDGMNSYCGREIRSGTSYKPTLTSLKATTASFEIPMCLSLRRQVCTNRRTR